MDVKLHLIIIGELQAGSTSRGSRVLFELPAKIETRSRVSPLKSFLRGTYLKGYSDRKHGVGML